LVDQIRTNGRIAGAALTLDESILLVSNLHKEQGTAQVLAVTLSTGAVGVINKGIATNTGAGGDIGLIKSIGFDGQLLPRRCQFGRVHPP
jgi:hypothetical protein